MANMFDRNEIYYIVCYSDPTALIGIYVEQRNGSLFWFDSLRERCLNKIELDDDGEALVVIDGRGYKYRFMPMSIEIYNLKVKPHIEGHPAISSRSDLAAMLHNLPAV